jgi:hypothetical protein
VPNYTLAAAENEYIELQKLPNKLTVNAPSPNPKKKPRSQLKKGKPSLAAIGSPEDAGTQVFALENQIEELQRQLAIRTRPESISTYPD